MNLENTFFTKYGKILMTASASDASEEDSSELVTSLKIGVTKDNSFGIKLRADGSPDPLRSDLTVNTAEIDDNPQNTYGLASKKYVRERVNEHATDSDAHKTLFNNILKQVTDLYEEKGELRAYRISDNYGNVINANGKVIWNGDTEHPKYIVFSSERNKDVDSKFTELSGAIDGKQTKLTVGTDLALTEAGNLSVTDMRYDDTYVRGKIDTIIAKETNLTNRIIAIEGKESTWDGKQDKINSPADIGAQPAGTYVTSDSQLKIKIVDEEPSVKEANTLYFIKES